MTDQTIDHLNKQAPLMEALNWRYATKKFDPDKKIPEGKVEELLEVLRLAPSSMGLQPYKFVRVLDTKLRQSLQRVSMNQLQITEASELIVFAARTDYTDVDISSFLEISQQARGFSDDDIEKRRQSLKNYVGKFDEGKFVDWAARQLYIALGMLLTAAAVSGIDACPMEGVKGKDYDEILGLKDQHLQTFAVVTLGYRAPDDALAEKAKIRFPKETLIKTIGV